ncbi:MAG: winged helix-turn-helix transcriptional regulator [Candidatus Bathyarchaeota archaeon]|nr:MAG: winged helix-turn-helix transcriptional regulator [Candidatus Bathyarchaeota archaeon]
MFDALLMASVLLLTLTLIASLLYSRHIRKVRDKYEEARDVVGDIIVSFNSQLQEYEETLSAVSGTTKAFSSGYEAIERRVKEQEEVLRKLSTEVNAYSGSEKKISAQIKDVDARMESLVISQEEIAARIEDVEKMGNEISTEPRAQRAKVDAPIPIRREKALAPLTETELRVLEILTDKSRKTAPEIRGEIGLTREHTARLMKKLYEEGYLERSAQRIPYTYRITKEMLKLLRKQV